jgi:hypothetical protein
MGWWEDVKKGGRSMLDPIMGADNSDEEKERKRLSSERAGALGELGTLETNERYGYEDTRGKMGKDYDVQVDEWNGRRNTIDEGYRNQVNELAGEADKQGKDANATYSNSIRPRMLNNAENAMSLADAQSGNSSVQQGWRKQGIADYGVLAGMGAQATAQGMAGNPMTAGQQAAMSGQNQRQAGNAYWQNVNQGADENWKAYNAGQSAIGDFNNSETQAQQRSANNRNERQGLRNEAWRVYSGASDREQDIRKGRYDRNQGWLKEDTGWRSGKREQEKEQISSEYQGDIDAVNNQIAANNQRANSTLSSIASVGGGILTNMGSSAMDFAKKGRGNVQNDPSTTTRPTGGIDENAPYTDPQTGTTYSNPNTSYGGSDRTSPVEPTQGGYGGNLWGGDEEGTFNPNNKGASANRVGGVFNRFRGRV